MRKTDKLDKLFSQSYPLKTIAQCWEEFASQVIPPDMDADERTRAKATFYAGVAFMYDQNIAIGNQVVMERAEQHLKDIDAELKAFRREMEQELAKRMSVN